MLLSTPQLSRIRGLDGHSINLCANGKGLERVSTFRLAAASFVLGRYATKLDLLYQMRSYTPVVPSKTIPDSRQNGQSLYPFSDQKWRKNHTLWGGTYLYGLYKGVPPADNCRPMWVSVV